MPLAGMPENFDDYQANKTHRADILAINPRGKLPALEDHANGVVLAESAAINTYLGDRFGDGKIVPRAGTAQRGTHDQWCYFLMAEIDAQSLWTNYKFTTMGGLYSIEKNEMTAESCRLYFNKQIKVCAEELKERGPYICGADFTAADILLTHCLNWAASFEWELPEDDVFQEYLQRTTTRPAYLAVYAPKPKL